MTESEGGEDRQPFWLEVLRGNVCRVDDNSVAGLASNWKVRDAVADEGIATMEWGEAMDDRRDIAYSIEKFSVQDLVTLRSELLTSGVDSFQAAEIVANFLTGRGYGCSAHEARKVASNIEVPGATAEHIQAELESVARVM